MSLEHGMIEPFSERSEGEGIAQVLFFRADERCETSYADRAGKYQGQSGITLPRVT